MVAVGNGEVRKRMKEANRVKEVVVDKGGGRTKHRLKGKGLGRSEVRKAGVKIG